VSKGKESEGRLKEGGLFLGKREPRITRIGTDGTDREEKLRMGADGTRIKKGADTKRAKKEKNAKKEEAGKGKNFCSLP
jgi:hypothetical protein